MVRSIALLLGLMVASCGCAQNLADGAEAENLALGKPYQIRPGTYGGCTDPGDTTQLTDGVRAAGRLWTEEAGVGWTGAGPEFITIDLGDIYPIGGASYSTAAVSSAGVLWPSQIIVFVSDNGEQWYRAGDLVELHTDREALPPTDAYVSEVIWSDRLTTHGRFVKLAVFTEGNYVFLDEVEVFRGPEELLAQSREGEPIASIETWMMNQPIFALQRKNFADVRADIASLPASQRATFAARAEALEDRVESPAPIDDPLFRPILPLTDAQQEIFALQAEVWRALGKTPVRLWQNNRWDPLGPAEEPSSDAGPVVAVEMMRNETRADVLNITSANPRPMRMQLRITGMPGGANPNWITVRQVEHVGSRFMGSVAAPLPIAGRSGEWWTIDVPAGMTRQVWFEINSSDLAPGRWEGAIELPSVMGGQQSVPLRVTVHPLTMPAEKTLSVGGWDYTDTDDQRGLTEENVGLVIEHLRARGVNSPWATSGVLPAGQYDAEGSMIAEPDTANFDRWLARWPDSKIYLVYAAVGAGFADAQMGTERFDRQVGQWARFWMDHALEAGLEPGQLAVLLVDEPRTSEQFETIMAWARAIKATTPEMLLFEDSFIIDDRDLMLETFEYVDILCPLRTHYIDHEQWREMVNQQRDSGTELWFYSCNGPAKTFGPYEYYLAQAWQVYAVGGAGSHFWSFTDTRGESTWNDYVRPDATPFTPIYLDPTGVTAAKAMEAIRESQQDFEYLVMLERRVEELAAAGASDAALADARRLLESGPARVYGDDPGAYRWGSRRDYDVQDQVRHEILEALLELQER